MFRKATPLFLICETPMHAGSGSDLGVIDLPIQRERHTSFPKIEGSSLKGSLREAFENKLTDVEDRKKIHLAFGFDDKTPEDDGIKSHFGDDKQFQGALGFSDARLLLFPVKSMKGVFAWITCPKVLEQFKRDMQVAKEKVEHEEKETKTPTSILDNIPSSSQNSSALLSSDDLIVNQTAQDDKRSIVLEEYSFKGEKNDDVTKLAKWLSENITKENFWKEKLKSNLVVLPDEDFTDFVNLSTEVITRTKINNETGTVTNGALFTEEYLPAETVMYSLALFGPIFHKEEIKKVFLNGQTKTETESQSDFETKVVGEFFTKTIKEKLPIVQIGGNATLGKGLVRTKVLGG